jgi:hypothetical protein
MRNDARPIGQNAHDESPIDEHQKPDASQPDVVNQRPAEDAPHDELSTESRDADPVRPASDSSPGTRI